MEHDELLSRVKGALAEAFGARLRGVVLYGSEARGEADPDSDIDLLVLLDGPVRRPNDPHACIDALYPLVLELERPIQARCADVEAYDRQELPLYRNARREGVTA
jgi:predicted nucleotidyltransferase